MQKIQVVQETPQNRRRIRSPRHSFNVSFLPWQIQPFMIAPVLPGETMSNLLLQGSARSDALLSDQLGWWFENYFFYVKHRDLKERDLVTQMHLDPATNVASLRAQNRDSFTGTFGGGVNWTRLALERIVEEYFRDEGEGVYDFVISGEAIASMNIKNFMESAIFDSDVPQHDERLPGEYPELPDQGIPPGMEAAYEHWQSMRAMQLTTATFEDYLKSFGVSPAKELQVEEIHRPELIRYIREWVLPQVKYDTSTGSAAPQVVVNMAERADKDRFFAEPGFIVGLVVARPKMYLNSIKGSGVGMMDNAYAWLPAVLSDEPYTSLKKFAANTGPVPDAQEAYWVDIKDLFMHGDEFKTFDVPEDNIGLLGGDPPPLPPTVGGDDGGSSPTPTPPTGGTGGGTPPPPPPPGDGGGGGPIVTMAPMAMSSSLTTDRGADIRNRFADDFALEQLFQDTAKTNIRYEGVVSLSVKSRIVDTSL